MALALELTLTTPSGDQTTRFLLSQQLTTIGHLPENDIQITNMCISRRHATVEKRHGHVFVHDHSTFGTWLNGMRLVSGSRGSVLRYDDVRARLPCIPQLPSIPMTAWPLSRHTCLLATHRTLSLASHLTLSARRRTPFVHTPSFA